MPSATRHGKSKTSKADPPRVLLVDDDPGVRELLEFLCRRSGFSVVSTGRARSALEHLAAANFDVVVQDLKMPEMDGLSLLEEIKKVEPGLPVIVITAFSTWENAVTAMRLGAFDYLRKPFDTNEVRAVIQRALRNRDLVEIIGSRPGLTSGNMIGNSPQIQEVRSIISRIAGTDSTILIRGESGTGKELVARAIHCQSHRLQAPFVSVNCASFDDNLLASELFGHVKGAFTDAHRDKLGLFEQAEGGTLFLDEIGEMSFPLQARFLRVLQERSFSRVGGTRPIEVDIRIIAATNRDLEEAVRKSNFRRDLFYRINVIPIFLPPLRERHEDLPLLIGHFLARYGKLFGSDVKRLTPESTDKLLAHDWPGNVRELENVIQRSVALSGGDEIGEILLGPTVEVQPESASHELPADGIDLEKRLAEIERQYLKEALGRTGGHLTKAAELLNISFRSMRYKVRKYDLKTSS